MTTAGTIDASTPSVETREAEIGDAEAIATAFRVVYGSSSHPCRHPRYVARSIRDPRTRWFVALKHGRLVGSVCARRHPLWRGVVEPSFQVVLPEERGTGLGRSLYLVAMGAALSLGPDIIVEQPRHGATIHLASAIFPPKTFVGHDGGENVANGMVEHHLVGVWLSQRAQLQRVLPTVGSRAHALVQSDDVLSGFGFGTPSCSTRSTVVVPDVLARSERRGRRRGRWEGCYVLAERDRAIDRLAGRGFRPSAYIPALFFHEGRRHDVLLMTHTASREPRESHLACVVADWSRRLQALVTP
jgi:hypothetical protein